jgi:SH3-like domain-containing protein
MEKKQVSSALKTLAAVMLCVALLAGTAAAAERRAVKAAIANIRNGAGTNFNVLWQVEKYHPFLILKKKGNWYEVKDFEGDIAWIHQSLVNKTKTVITIKEKCNVRAKPTTKSRIVLKVERGVPFKVLGQQGKWIRIEHADGETGWIYQTLVW